MVAMENNFDHFVHCHRSPMINPVHVFVHLVKPRDCQDTEEVPETYHLNCVDRFHIFFRDRNFVRGAVMFYSTACIPKLALKNMVKTGTTE